MIPLFTYMYSDPLIHLDNNEEQDVECLEIVKERRLIKSVCESSGVRMRWIAKNATEEHFITTYSNSYIFHFTGHGVDGEYASFIHLIIYVIFMYIYRFHGF